MFIDKMFPDIYEVWKIPWIKTEEDAVHKSNLNPPLGSRAC